MSLLSKYGKTALVAGASEGIGAAFATCLAKNKMNLVLIARRIAPLETFATTLREKYQVRVQTVSCDLSTPQALSLIHI